MKKLVSNIFYRRTCVHCFRKIGGWHLGSVTSELFLNFYLIEKYPKFFLNFFFWLRVYVQSTLKTIY